MFNITVIDKNNNPATRIISEGTRVSAIVGPDLSKCLVNDARVTRDIELREGDEVQLITPSGKQE